MTKNFSVEYFFLELGLYKPVKFDFRQYSKLKEIFNSPQNLQFDCFCVECKKNSTFKISNKFNHVYIPNFSIEDLNRYKTPFIYEFTCQRDNSHKYFYMFRITGYEIIKIGQYPSIADIEVHSIKKYRKILSNDYLAFSKAIGLYSHGVGIGSFVYLRRIFENLIEESHKLALKDDKFNETEYQNAKMDEKIKLLENYLPDVLVKNRKIYSILSKGIHEFSEDECLDLFPKVKLAIELILDQKLAQIEKESKIKQLEKFISQTVEKFN